MDQMRTETQATISAARPTRSPMSPQRRRLVMVAGISAVVVLLALLGAVGYSAFTHESTDDAFVDAHVSNMAARVAGQVVAVAVDDNRLVKAGALLVQIDPRDYQAQLDEARANLLSAEATSRRADLDYARYQRLLRTDDVTRQQVDVARADADSARAKVQQAQAAVRTAELNLSYTRIVAPQDGLVTHKSVAVGDYLKTGSAVMVIVPNQAWVTANFKETQLKRMRPGQEVRIKVDAYPGVKFKGHVDSIQSGTGAQFSVLPPENATGNYVKVVQRIPVKIIVDQADGKYRLAPGMSVVPKIRVR